MKSESESESADQLKINNYLEKKEVQVRRQDSKSELVKIGKFI